MKIISLLLLILALLAPIKAIGQVLTLDQCFEAALKRSETIAMQDEFIKQAEEKIRQAKGYLFPSVNLTAQYLRQEALHSGGTESNIFPKSQPLVKLSGTQPIFRGFRDFSTLSQAKLEKNAEIEAKYSAKVSLYNDVSRNYFALLSVRKDIKNLHDEIDLLQKRNNEIKERVRIGRSRASEIITTELTIARIEADIENSNGQRSVEEEIFYFLTGSNKDSQLADDFDVPKEVETLDSYLTSVEDRPDVKNAKINYLATKKNVNIAKGSNYPSIDLNGNYYFLRSGSTENINWDFSILATLPIFSGGVMISKVSEARSQAIEAELSYSLARRNADQEIKTAFHEFKSALSQVIALEKAKNLSEKNYILQSKEYRLGLVNNVDVLDSLSAFNETQRGYDQVKYLAKTNYIKLQSVSNRIDIVIKGK